MAERWVLTSDWHLGGGLTRTPELLSFLDTLHADTLVIVGDLFDAGAGLFFPDAEVEILEAMDDFRDRGGRLVRLPGNHDPLPFTHLVGADETPAEMAINSGGRTFSVVHGDRWDTALLAHPELTRGVIWWERWLAHLSPQLARHAKEWFQIDRNLPALVRAGALVARETMKVDAVVCGHTHVPEQTPRYVNLGCWCGSGAPTYAVIQDGDCRLEEFRP